MNLKQKVEQIYQTQNLMTGYLKNLKNMKTLDQYKLKLNKQGDWTKLKLTKIQRKVIELKEKGYTLEEIGKRMKFTKQRAREIILLVLNKL